MHNIPYLYFVYDTIIITRQNACKESIRNTPAGNKSVIIETF